MQPFQFFILALQFFGQFFIVGHALFERPFFLFLFFEHLRQFGFFLYRALFGFGYFPVFLIYYLLVFGLEFQKFLLCLKYFVFFYRFGLKFRFFDDSFGFLFRIAYHLGVIAHYAAAVQK